MGVTTSAISDKSVSMHSDWGSSVTVNKQLNCCYLPYSGCRATCVDSLIWSIAII